jgi:hypothetical protein
MPLFPNPQNVIIYGGNFNDVQGNINYGVQPSEQGEQRDVFKGCLVKHLDLSDFRVVDLTSSSLPSEDPTRKYKPVVRSCPSPTSIFTGRKDILLQLHECFTASPTSVESAKQRRFVLYGLGGGGKTQIALKFVKECQVERLPQRYVFNSDLHVVYSS